MPRVCPRRAQCGQGLRGFSDPNARLESLCRENWSRSIRHFMTHERDRSEVKHFPGQHCPRAWPTKRLGLPTTRRSLASMAIHHTLSRFGLAGVSCSAGADRLEAPRGPATHDDRRRPSIYDVVVLGAGYAGLMAALRLARRNRGCASRWSVRAISSSNACGCRKPLWPRSRRASRRFRPSSPEPVSNSSAAALLRSMQTVAAVRIATEREVARDRVRSGDLCTGSNIDVDGIPGAAEHAYRLEAGDGPRSAAALRARLRIIADRPLRVVTVGGAETGVEVAGEIKTAWPSAEVTMVSRSRCGDFRGARVEKAVRSELDATGSHFDRRRDRHRGPPGRRS